MAAQKKRAQPRATSQSSGNQQEINQQEVLNCVNTLRGVIPEVHRDRNMRNRLPEALKGFPAMFTKYAGWITKNLQHFGQAEVQSGQPSSTRATSKSTAKRSRASTSTPKTATATG